MRLARVAAVVAVVVMVAPDVVRTVAIAQESETPADRRKAAITGFKKVKDGRDPAPRIAAIQSLAEHPHKDTVKALAKYVQDPRKGVGVATAKVLTTIGQALTPKQLTPVLKALATGLKVRTKASPVPPACCVALSVLRDERAVPLLVPLLEHKDNLRASAAAQALGFIPAVAGVDALVDTLAKVTPSTSGGTNPGGTSLTAAQAARNKALRWPCVLSLRRITGQRWTDQAEWKKWWKKNKSAFARKLLQRKAEKARKAKKKDR